MSKYTDEEVNRILSDTGELAADVSGAEKFDLEDILAEFGPGSAAPKAPPETQAAESPEPKAEEASISPAEPEAAAEELPEEEEPPQPASSAAVITRLKRRERVLFMSDFSLSLLI